MRAKILLSLVFVAVATAAVPAASFDRALRDSPSGNSAVPANEDSTVAAREKAARELSQLCETYYTAAGHSFSADEAWKILELWAKATGEIPPNRSVAWLEAQTGLRDAGTAARCFVRALGCRAAETRTVTRVLRNESGDVALRRRVGLANKIFFGNQESLYASYFTEEDFERAARVAERNSRVIVAASLGMDEAAVRAGVLSSIDGIPESLKMRKRALLFSLEKKFQAKLVEAVMRSPTDCTQAHIVFGEELIRGSDLEKFFRESASGRVILSLMPYSPGGITNVSDDFIDWIESLPESRLRELGNFSATDYRVAMMQMQSLGMEMLASLVEKNPELKARMKRAESLPSESQQRELAAIQTELVNSIAGELVQRAMSDKKYRNAVRVLVVVKLSTPKNLTTCAERTRWEQQLTDAELTKMLSFTVSDVRRAINDLKKYYDDLTAAFIDARPYLPKLIGDEM